MQAASLIFNNFDSFLFVLTVCPLTQTKRKHKPTRNYSGCDGPSPTRVKTRRSKIHVSVVGEKKVFRCSPFSNKSRLIRAVHATHAQQSAQPTSVVSASFVRARICCASTPVGRVAARSREPASAATDVHASHTHRANTITTSSLTVCLESTIASDTGWIPRTMSRCRPTTSAHTWRPGPSLAWWSIA